MDWGKSNNKNGTQRGKTKDLITLEINDVYHEAMNAEPIFKRTFQITIDSGGCDYDWSYHMYTDGSEKNGAGTRFCSMRDEDILIRDNIGLPTKATSSK